MERTIDIFAALRTKQPERGRARTFVEFKAPDVVFSVDEQKVAGDVAAAITEALRENLLNGLDFNGRPLPPVSAATAERRDYRVRQAQGKPTKELLRRFTTAKLGTFLPSGEYGGNRWVGVESGLLAKSIKAVAEGGAWRVFVAGVRGLVDRSGRSALTRVMEKLGPLTGAIGELPKVQQALRALPGRLFLSRVERTLQQLKKMGETGQRLGELLSTPEAR